MFIWLVIWSGSSEKILTFNGSSSTYCMSPCSWNLELKLWLLLREINYSFFRYLVFANTIKLQRKNMFHYGPLPCRQWPFPYNYSMQDSFFRRKKLAWKCTLFILRLTQTTTIWKTLGSIKICDFFDWKKCYELRVVSAIKKGKSVGRGEDCLFECKKLFCWSKENPLLQFGT